MPYDWTVHTSKNGVDIASPNCLECHAGRWNGELVIGLGRADVDYTEPLGDGLAGFDVPDLAIPGIEDIGLTTNGILLAEQAQALYDAGLRRINVSLDALDPVKFQEITRREGYERVVAGISKAQEVGFDPVKVNAVSVRGITETEIVPFGHFARETGVEMRFIEYMPLDADNVLHPEMLEETVAVLDAHPDVGVAYTDFEEFGDSNRVRRRPDFDLDLLCRYNLMENTSLFRREAWLATGGYNPNMAGGLEDWDFWLSCAEHGFPGRRIPRVLFSYRRQTGSRNEAAAARQPELLRQLRANHPRLFTPAQRARRWARRTGGRLLARLRRVAWTTRP